MVNGLKALRVKDVAKRLACSTDNVHKMIEDGRLAAINVASRPHETRAAWRIPEKALEALLAQSAR